MHVSTTTSVLPVIETAPVVEQVRPWVRFWARMLDVLSFSLIFGLILGLIAPQVLVKPNDAALGIFAFFAWIFVEAVMLSTFQTTIGKWLFKTNISLNSGASISFSDAISRSFKVWWRGLGAGLPIVSLITMNVAHGRLTRNGRTSWDEDTCFSVTHERIGILRVLAAITFFLLFLVVVAFGQFIGAAETNRQAAQVEENKVITTKIESPVVGTKSSSNDDAIAAQYKTNPNVPNIQGLQAKTPAFTDHPVAYVYSGKPAKVILRSEADRAFRSRIRYASKEPANFAGSYSLAIWGCGTTCLMAAAVELKTGNIVFFPGSITGWSGEGDSLEFNLNSRLLIASGYINEEGEHGKHYYEINGTSFTHLKTVVFPTNSE